MGSSPTLPAQTPLEAASKELREAVEAAASMPKSAVVGTLDGEPLRADFPLLATVFGVEAVVIPRAEYERLTAKAELIARMRPLPVQSPIPPAPLPSTIERDPEVAAFLRELFGRARTLASAHEACLERFGPERTPSPSRIARFRSKRHRGA